MFFYASKIFWTLLQPSSLMLLALLIGLLLVWRGRTRRGLRWLVGSLLAIVLTGFTSLSDLFIAPLEARFPRPDLSGQRVAGVIALGGAEDSNGAGRELMSLNEAGERMTEAAALALRFPEAKLVFSGGSGALLREEPPAAEQASRLWQAFGVQPYRIALEDKSRNTHENAVFSHQVLQPKPGERWLLVTSAWHMPRAVACFRAAGFEVSPWPVDYRTDGSFDPLKLFGAAPDGLKRFDFVFKEYVGLLAYRLTGRTRDLWPAP